MPQFIKMGLHSTGYATHRCKKRNEQRRQARARVLPGFPVVKKFQTIDEIKSYFSGDRITCLLCGRDFRNLGNHITQMHDITPEQYKNQYGLPWRRGLTSDASHKAYGDAIDQERRDRFRDMARPYLCKSAKKRRLSTAEIKERTRRILQASVNRDHGYTESEWTAFLTEVASGQTPREVFRKAQMPKQTAFYKKMRRDPAFQKEFDRIWESLPFSVQARGQRLGARFTTAVARNFEKGMSDHKSAELLGVTAMTVNKITKALRSAHS